MYKVKAWFNAARLRTLPLAASGILVGGGLALYRGSFDWVVFSLALITTLLFQILSNFANDYGDGIKGTDNDQRIGPARAFQSGLLTDKELKRGMILTATLGFLCAGHLIYYSLHDVLLEAIGYIFLGLLSIAAAIKYTVGNDAYGYRGLGDLSVFLFFGLVSVVGSYYLYERTTVTSIEILPAITMGALSAGVLNLNNMRDRISDAQAGKKTLVVSMGGPAAVVYHTALILLSIATLAITISKINLDYKEIVYIGFVPLLIHLYVVRNIESPHRYDPQLKVLALSTFFISALFFGINYL